MFKEILAPNTDDEMGIGTDNMTAVLIYFPKNMGIKNEWTEILRWNNIKFK